MSARLRFASVLVLLMAFALAGRAFAKGGFSFIMVSGPGLPEPVRVTDTRLTADFFVFANFFEDRTNAPEHPGEAYVITRHYVDGSRDWAFDQLQYYPGSGLVYYDGIVNGWSEYDDHWYTAQPGISELFDRIVFAKGEPDSKFDSVRSAAAFALPEPRPWRAEPRAVIPAVVVGALVFIAWYILSVRRPAVR